jgi:pyrimidine dimer DNA glycosylase
LRIWDISAGYLNDRSLLGEHRELHGIVSIHVNALRGYSKHPETIRWTGCLTGLARRHEQLVAEMTLRGMRHLSPLAVAPRKIAWPSTFLAAPGEQLQRLRRKYAGKAKGRIRLPNDAAEIWAQHRFSLWARDASECRAFRRAAERAHGRAGILPVALALTHVLREAPSRSRIVDTLERMWSHVSRSATAMDRRAARGGPADLLRTIQELAVRDREAVLTSSTALSELAVFLRSA